MPSKSQLYYRNTYLRSDHWRNLRLEKLASVDAYCFRCGVRDLSNDVHHTVYRKLYDVTLRDLIVLCRPCHQLLHESIDAARNGDVDSVKTLAIKIQEGKGMNHLPQFGRLFKKLREQNPNRKKSNFKPKKNKPKVKLRISMRIWVGFKSPETRPLFIQLRRVGFLRDLHRGYSTRKPKHPTLASVNCWA